MNSQKHCSKHNLRNEAICFGQNVDPYQAIYLFIQFKLYRCKQIVWFGKLLAAKITKSSEQFETIESNFIICNCLRYKQEVK